MWAIRAGVERKEMRDYRMSVEKLIQEAQRIKLQRLVLLASDFKSAEQHQLGIMDSEVAHQLNETCYLVEKDGQKKAYRKNEFDRLQQEFEQAYPGLVKQFPSISTRDEQFLFKNWTGIITRIPEGNNEARLILKMAEDAPRPEAKNGWLFTRIRDRYINDLHTSPEDAKFQLIPYDDPSKATVEGNLLRDYKNKNWK